MTVALCYGTRSELINAARLARVLGQRWEVLTVYTEPGHDDESNARLRAELGMVAARVALDASAPAPVGTAAVVARATELFARHAPRAVVVIGDTERTLACAVAAAKLRIPLVHVEAGVRARDPMAPAEVTRRVVEAMSDVLCAPSTTAATRLHAEGVDGGKVVCTGDVAHDTLRVSAARAVPPASVARWPLAAGEPYFLAALRRPELVDDAGALRRVLRALGRAPFPVVLTAHPLTRHRLTSVGALGEAGSRVHVLPALGYLEMIGCVRGATALVTDSGGAQREAYWLGTPCVTLRRETEWTETVTLGANTLIPADEAEARLPGRLAELAFGGRRAGWQRDAYGDGRAAERIRDAIETSVSAQRAA